VIARLRPWLNSREIGVALRPADRGAVARFEAAFAAHFQARTGVAFPYGRSALWMLLQALGLHDVEVILPAYTCSVVAHAVLLAGNVPRFVDCRLDDYNMDFDAMAAAISPRTRMVVATHLFGYPLNVDRLEAIVAEAERRYGHRIVIVHDLAHAFGARWRGELIAPRRDVALFGLNISKMMTSIFGGMLVSNDAALIERVRAARDDRGRRTGARKSVLRRLYLLATYLAFKPANYRLVNWLERRTPMLNRLTTAYHLDGKVAFPPDAFDLMSGVEAEVGLVQLEKLADIEQRRLEHARAYAAGLQGVAGIVLPPQVDGATYSHYVIRVADRAHFLNTARVRGVQLGELIEYSVPELPPYQQFAIDGDFPNAHLCSGTTINLPVHAALTERDRERVLDAVRAAAASLAANAL
jgi:dTDP-4-amino-4,6-dideoxygalactose transaminase